MEQLATLFKSMDNRERPEELRELRKTRGQRPNAVCDAGLSPG